MRAYTRGNTVPSFHDILISFVCVRVCVCVCVREEDMGKETRCADLLGDCNWTILILVSRQSRQVSMFFTSLFWELRMMSMMMTIHCLCLYIDTSSFFVQYSDFFSVFYFLFSHSQLLDSYTSFQTHSVELSHSGRITKKWISFMSKWEWMVIFLKCDILNISKKVGTLYKM